MFYLNLREMHRNPTYCWDLPAEGLEPTRSCDHWILSPARLPIPPRRRWRLDTTKLQRKLKRFRPVAALLCGAARLRCWHLSSGTLWATATATATAMHPPRP